MFADPRLTSPFMAISEMFPPVVAPTPVEFAEIEAPLLRVTPFAPLKNALPPARPVTFTLPPRETEPPVVKSIARPPDPEEALEVIAPEILMLLGENSKTPVARLVAVFPVNAARESVPVRETIGTNNRSSPVAPVLTVRVPAGALIDVNPPGLYPPVIDEVSKVKVADDVMLELEPVGTPLNVEPAVPPVVEIVPVEFDASGFLTR